MIGERVSHFEVFDKLGEGGMGTVWKARDTLLNRIVALKLVLPARALKPEVRHRFWQEAKSASALNHPNIVTIFEAGEHGEAGYIAMEFIEGVTLDHALHVSGLRLGAALRYAIQIADAVAAAHGAGIIHRDLKPGNVMITRSDQVKVLDFGLAKPASLLAAAGSAEDQTDTIAATEEGTIVGTTAYMSPEQAQGKPLDQRSDIFAFGSLLYEMVTGRRAFRGETKVSTLSAILTAEPRPVSEISRNVPAELERIIRRCLRKDPAQRFQHMDDVRVALAELVEESTESKPAASRAPKFGKRAAIAVAVLLAVTAGTAAWIWKDQRSAATAKNLHVRRLSTDTAVFDDPVFSPDGKFIVYASDRQGAGNLELWLHQLATGEAVRLTNDPADDHCASFSPDGSVLVFRSDRAGGGVYQISAVGGTPRLLAKEGKRPRFSPDGKWISYWVGNEASGDAHRAGQHFIIPSRGGEAKEILGDLRYPVTTVWSPDSCCILAAPQFPGDFGAPKHWTVAAVAGGPSRQVDVSDALASSKLDHAYLHAWPSVERGIIAAGGTVRSTLSPHNLWVLSMDPRTWTVDGAPQPLTFGSDNNDSAHALPDGRVAFVTRSSRLDIWQMPVRLDEAKPAGEMRRMTDNRDAEIEPVVTPDGKHVLYTLSKGDNQDIVALDLESGTERPVVASPDRELWGRVSPDGRLVAYRFRTTATGPSGSRVVPMTGGEAKTLCNECGYPSSWTPDGRSLLLNTRTTDGRNIVTLYDLDRGGAPTPVLEHPKHSLWQSKISPDGRWIVFLASIGKMNQIYTAPWAGGRPIPQQSWMPFPNSNDVSDKPFWSPGGRLIYYISNRDSFGCIYAQRIDPETGRAAGEPIVIKHFHDAQRSIMRVGMGAFGMTGNRDKVVLNMLSTTSDIWLLEP